MRGAPLGAGADLSVLSFGRGKGWTGGGGGALLLRGRAAGAAEGLREELVPPPEPTRASTAMKLTAQWLLGRPALYGIPARLPFLGLGETVYHPPTPPRPMSAMSARIVSASHDAATAEAAVRRDRAARLREALAPLEGLWLPPDDPGAGYLRLPLRAPGRRATDVVGTSLRALGLIPGYPTALPDLPAVAGLLGRREEWPGARALAAELFTAPTHSRATTSPRRLAAVVEAALRLS